MEFESLKIQKLRASLTTMKLWEAAKPFDRKRLRYGDRVMVLVPGLTQFRFGIIVPSRAYYRTTKWGELTMRQYMAICSKTFLGWRPPAFGWRILFEGDGVPVPFGRLRNMRINHEFGTTVTDTHPAE